MTDIADLLVKTASIHPLVQGLPKETIHRFQSAQEEAREILANLDRISMRGMNEIASKMDGLLLLELLAQSDDQTKAAASNAISREQSKRAKHDRTKCPVRASFITAMHAFRSNGGTCQDFIDAAQNGSIDGAFLKRKETRGVEVYSASIEADEELAGEKAPRADRRLIEAKRKTLNDWWTEAGKELAG